jgi:hypothetical protein
LADGVRIGWSTSSFGLALDSGVLVAVTTVMVIIAGRLYRRAVT